MSLDHQKKKNTEAFYYYYYHYYQEGTLWPLMENTLKPNDIPILQIFIYLCIIKNELNFKEYRVKKKIMKTLLINFKTIFKINEFGKWSTCLYKIKVLTYSLQNSSKYF